MGFRTISSRDNPLYKELKQLAESSQARRKAGRTVLDGVHLCNAYLERHGKPVLCAVAKSAQTHAEVAQILEKCIAQAVTVAVLPDSLCRSIQIVEQGVGIVFLIDTPKREMPAALSGSVVLLDGVQDPGNMGSILRSAAAAGVSCAYCGPGTAFAWSPKVLRAGMGAHFALDIYEDVDLATLIRGANIPVVATTSHAAQKLYQIDLRRDVAWLMGHEGQGISASLMPLVTHRAQIPHLGDVESLNVAAAAAVCFFEQLRQRSYPSA